MLKSEQFPDLATNIEAAVSDFRESGYCVLADALSKDQVAGMKSRLIEQADAERAQGVAFRDGGAEQNWGAFRDADGRIRAEAFTEEAGGRNQRVWMLINKGEVFNDIFKVKSVRSIVDRFLGEEYLLSSYGANIAKPGGIEMPLHTDQWWMPTPTRANRDPLPVGSMRRDRFDRDDEPRESPLIAPLVAINVIWMLVDFTAEIGATRLVPGSHLSGCQPDENGNRHAVQPEAPAGSAIVLDARTWHGTGANTGTTDRLALLSTFCGPQFRSQENLTVGTHDSVLAEADDNLRALLGFKVWNAYGRVESPAVEFIVPGEKSFGEMKSEREARDDRAEGN
ncbi:MAG: phytanoyl-CoA dioxygenase family protein [Candidatus Latescibacterota bacterium]|nr:phytanoyl-CoA dioxygenase family protein [Candidatus Latescibacterota bacterium]